MEFLRFLTASPSFADFPDSPDFKANAEKNFNRILDNNKFSFWERDQNEFVIAYWLISKPHKPDTINWIVFDNSFFTANNFQIVMSVDQKAPSCISHFHYLFHCPDSQKDFFIEKLQEYLRGIPEEERRVLIRKNEFKKFLEDKSAICSIPHEELTQNKWVFEL